MPKQDTQGKRPLDELERRAAPAASGGTVDQGAARANAGKPPLHLLPLDALVPVAWVLAFGAEKYSARGWEKAAAEGVFSWVDCVRACLSHLTKLMSGQRLDPESGLPHVAHLACNALFLCGMLVRCHGKHDLPGQAGSVVGGLHHAACSGDWVPGPEYVRAVEALRNKRNTPNSA
jgi:hypothetical protein